MRVCVIAEGCYPYVVGGVSSWVHSLIRSFPNLEFIVLSIISDRSMRGKFAYELPENVTEVYELYLNDCDWVPKQKKKLRRHKKLLSHEEYLALRSLVLGQDVNWEVLFDLFAREDLSINTMLMGEDFFHVVTECYNIKYSQVNFSTFLWTMRSIYLPLFYTLHMKIPQADVYHCVATGYSGVLGSMGRHFYNSRMVISEHGIYTREREEELIKAKWVGGIYKDLWIEQFKKLSVLGYDKADVVTCLYAHAKELQIELGCSKEKILITPNGIDVSRFDNIPRKDPSDDKINIGAVLRVTPIKDVKTMIQAYGHAKKQCSKLKLWIMGGWDEDGTYAQECFDLVGTMKLEDVEFTGRINTLDYIGKMDVTILTSVSEGQPLTILESYAAHVPVIATDVGNCRGLIYGEGDGLGDAGILTHIMNIEEIASAMVTMAVEEERRLKMGEIGYQRLLGKYQIHMMKDTYEEIYRKLQENLDIEWPLAPLSIS